MNELKVLYEDKHLIAVIKPYGVLSQGNENTKSLCDDISSYLKEKGENGECYVIHRLDKTTGGVMFFAKTKAMASKMSTLIQNGGFHKVYYAVLSGKLKDKTGALADLLYHDKAKNKTYVVKKERKGVKVAKLCYVSHGSAEFQNKDVTKVEVLLLTGRTHQIRVQFASRKYPLVGDKKYGSSIPYKQIALWSREINFKHPFSGEFIKVTAEPDLPIFNLDYSLF
ncbi:MAG: RluA family pseudouridine synthase [Ruminococcus sp.]|nr:RluA family pseudouridine synthase [Ruminococcus sp.]